jgi:hypothetical protein
MPNNIYYFGGFGKSAIKTEHNSAHIASILEEMTCWGLLKINFTLFN